MFTYIYIYIYIFIYLFIYLVAPALSCGMRTLSCGMHVGSSSLTRDRTQAPALGARNLNHCSSREVPTYIYLKYKNLEKECTLNLGLDSFWEVIYSENELKEASISLMFHFLRERKNKEGDREKPAPAR